MTGGDAVGGGLGAGDEALPAGADADEVPLNAGALGLIWYVTVSKLGAMTFPAPGSVPPMVMSSSPSQMTLVTVRSFRVPVRSVPMRFP